MKTTIIRAQARQKTDSRASAKSRNSAQQGVRDKITVATSRRSRKEALMILGLYQGEAKKLLRYLKFLKSVERKRRKALENADWYP